MVSAIAVLVAAVVMTVFTVGWIWNKADALTPVDLPAAKGTPLETVSPSAKTSTLRPEPVGEFRDGFLISFQQDRMPAMPAPLWKSERADFLGPRGGAMSVMTVHKNAAGKGVWFSTVAFGGLSRVIPYRGPADLKRATQSQGGILLGRAYPTNKARPTDVKRRPLTVDGRPAFEITARFPVQSAEVKQETFAIIAITVIDRGDGTAATAVADIAGSTPQWLTTWRQQVQQIKIKR